jgi:tetratricopeptide (TPR) repeat protein
MARLVPEPKQRSSWLIGTAANLLAIGRNSDASALLAMASCSGSQEGERLSLLASLEASAGHWYQALNLASRALHTDKRNRTATMVLIRALAETGNPQMALTKAQEFVRVTADAESLFLLARVANAAGDHAVEIDALKRLVALGRKNNQPVGASLLYLGQSLARDGQRGEALRALDEAQAATELTSEQKQLIKELRDHLAPSS